MSMCVFDNNFFLFGHTFFLGSRAAARHIAFKSFVRVCSVNVYIYNPATVKFLTQLFEK